MSYTKVPSLFQNVLSKNPCSRKQRGMSTHSPSPLPIAHLVSWEGDAYSPFANNSCCPVLIQSLDSRQKRMNYNVTDQEGCLGAELQAPSPPVIGNHMESGFLETGLEHVCPRACLGPDMWLFFYLSHPISNMSWQVSPHWQRQRWMLKGVALLSHPHSWSFFANAGMFGCNTLFAVFQAFSSCTGQFRPERERHITWGTSQAPMLTLYPHLPSCLPIVLLQKDTPEAGLRRQCASLAKWKRLQW